MFEFFGKMLDYLARRETRTTYTFTVQGYFLPYRVAAYLKKHGIQVEVVAEEKTPSFLDRMFSRYGRDKR